MPLYFRRNYDRIHSLSWGQTESVVIHHIITKGTVDEIALKRLSGKAQGQDELLEAVKAEIEKARRD